MGESKRRKILDANYGKSQNIWHLTFLANNKESVLVTKENAKINTESIYEQSFLEKYSLTARLESITTKETYPCLIIPYLCPDKTVLSHLVFLIEKGKPQPRLSQKEIDDITLAASAKLVRDAKNIIKSPTHAKIILR